MEELINHLESIRAACKEWHYSATGLPFYGNHLLADKIQTPLYNFIDDIKEVHFLANSLHVPQSEIKPANGNPADILAEIIIAIYKIEELARTDITQGELNLLGTISEHLMRSRGLLNQTLSGGEK